MRKPRTGAEPPDREVRQEQERTWKKGKNKLATTSFTRHTGKIWNQAPSNVKKATSVNIARRYKIIKGKTVKKNEKTFDK